jgi:hypothetical protein
VYKPTQNKTDKAAVNVQNFMLGQLAAQCIVKFDCWRLLVDVDAWAVGPGDAS